MARSVRSATFGQLPRPRRLSNRVPFSAYLAARISTSLAGRRSLYSRKQAFGIHSPSLSPPRRPVPGRRTYSRLGSRRVAAPKMDAGSAGEVRKVGTVRDLVWKFYRTPKCERQKPRPSLSMKGRTAQGAGTARHALPIRDWENDLRNFAIRRKISSWTMSRHGARDMNA